MVNFIALAYPLVIVQPRVVTAIQGLSDIKA
jgi:hypothetical protein